MTNSTKIVDLQKLVQQPTSLKLLILHTPFTLQISSLWRCTNLIKLDLSKNNLQRFPHIGNLVNLKFMFLHQNKLDHNVLRGIFYSQDQPTYSPLSKLIVWVTFWGNKNVFLGRHFLINQTSVIAVDNYMVMPQQRKQSVLQNRIQPFSQQTDISYILQSKSSLGKNASEEQYMDQFWEQMRYLRKKIQYLSPIIKIQKLFRGWLTRRRLQDKKNKYLFSLQLKSYVFKSWKNQIIRNKKLFKFLEKRNRQHYLLPLRQMKIQSIKHKMLEWAARAKQKVSIKRISLLNQVKFYKVLRSNLVMFRSLYSQLQIEKSNFLLIDGQSFKTASQTIYNFIQLFDGDVTFQVILNRKYMVRQVNEGIIKKQFAHFLSVNQRSYVIRLNESKIKNQVKSLLNQNICNIPTHSTQLKPLYKNQNKVHLSTRQKNKIKQKFIQLQKRQDNILEEFLIIKANQRVLKDFVRCVYLINTQAIKIDNGKYIDADCRIKIFSQRSVRKLSSVTLIQKFWRGFIFRKKQKSNAQLCAKQYRAVVKIQRWIKNLPQRKKYAFRIQLQRIFKTINDSCFVVKMDDYLKVVKNMEDSTQNHLNRMKIIQQNITPYFNIIDKNITLFWDPEQNGSAQYNATIKTCFQTRKSPFDNFFIKSLFKCSDSKQIFYDPLVQNQDTQKGQFSHLFHFNTHTSLAQKQSTYWMKVSCNSIKQTKVRVLGILLKTFSFKKGFGIKIHGSEIVDFKMHFKKDILNNQSVFITKGDVLLKQTNLNIQKYNFRSKIYLKEDLQDKPLKLEQNLLIFVHKSQLNKKDQSQNHMTTLNDQITVQIQKKKTKAKLIIEQMYFSEPGNLQKSQTSEINFRRSINKKEEFCRSNTQKDELLPHAFKRILPLKRQIRSYKVQKRIKKRQPSFILDNASKIERVVDLTLQQTLQAQSSEKSLLQYSTVKQKMKKQYKYRKDLAKSHKQQYSFHQNFMNINNFLQQQSITEQRRRIKTELQMSAYESADRIRISEQKLSDNLQKRKQDKMKKVQIDIKIHKENLQKHRKLKQQNQLQFKKLKSLEKQKNQHNRHQVRRLKVSFAQECFPIVNRSYNNVRSHSQSLKKVQSNRESQRKYKVVIQKSQG